MSPQRPMWNSHPGQPEWVGRIVRHQGLVFDWLLEAIREELKAIHRRLDAADQRMEHFVSSFDDLVAVSQTLADGVTRLEADYAALKAAIGQVSPEDQAKLDAAVAQMDATVASISTSDPVVTAPPADGGAPTDGSTLTDGGSTDQPTV